MSNTVGMAVTRLYEVKPDGSRYLMNEIHAGSRFNSVDIPKKFGDSLHSAEAQLHVAKELKRGWTMFGPYPERSYVIEQTTKGLLPGKENWEVVG